MKSFRKHLILLLFIMSCYANIFGQTMHCEGTIIDANTKEGIPFCSVFFNGTSTGTFSDEDGKFTLTADASHDSLSVSSIGYQKYSLGLENKKNSALSIELKPEAHVLGIAIVLAGENPAHRIVKEVIKNKKVNQVKPLNNNHWKEYAKIEVDLEGIKQPSKKKGLLKSFDYAFEHIDTSSEDSPFLPIYFNETIADVYFDEENKLQKTFTASKASGLKNESVILFVNDFQEDYNVYDNWIEIFDKPFAGPFAKGGFHNYEYYLLDSILENSQKYYEIKFKPKRKSENTFKGLCWIDAKTFAIQNIEMKMSDEVNINFVKSVEIKQSYQRYNDIWIPSNQYTRIQLKPMKKIPGMIGRKTSVQYDVKQNTPQQLHALKEADPKALSKDEEFWNKERPEALSIAEKGIYTMVDSIQNIPMYKTISELFKVAFVGKKEIGLIEIGPYFSLTSNNILEGQRFKLGAWTSNKFSKKIKFGGYLAYGLRDEKFKYGGDLKWIIKKEPRRVLGINYKNDNSLNTDNDFEVGEGNMFASFLRRDIPQKLILDKKVQFFLEQYWNGGVFTRLKFKHHDMDPVANLMENGAGFNFAYQESGDFDAVIDTSIVTAELSLDFSYAFKEKFLDTGFNRTSLGSKYPIIGFNYTLGKKGIAGSSYDYHKLSLKVHQQLKVNPFGQLNYAFEAGKVIGNVPFLLSNVHRGNETYFLMGSAFNTMNKYEFVSDEFVSLKLEHHFDGFIFNKIPLIRKLNWRTVASFKALKGRMTKENLKANHLNAFDSNNTKFIGIRSPASVPFMETSIGIENIFKVLRVDALWRLNYLDNPEAMPFLVKLGMDLRF